MVSFTVRMTFDPQERQQIETILRELTAASRQEPGCVHYIPHFVEGEPATVFLYEQYRDEAALEHHRGTEHFAQYATGGLYPKMLERQLEQLALIA